MEKLYNNLPPRVKQNAKVIMLPVAVGTGVVYGMDNMTGDVVEFSFARASGGTYFDKEYNVLTAGTNIPRLDVGVYSNKQKLLMEKSSTNLIVWSDDLDKWTTRSCSRIKSTYNRKNWWLVTRTASNSTAYLYSSPDFNYINISGLPYSCRFSMRKGNTEDGYTITNNLSAPNRKVVKGTATFSNTGGQAYKLKFKDSDEVIAEVNGVTIKSHLFPQDVLHYGIGGGVNSNIGENNYCGGLNQIENSTTCTSHIYTTGNQSTRSADLLSYTMSTDASAIIQTSRNGKIELNIPSGNWNIHNDIPESDGIEYIALFFDEPEGGEFSAPEPASHFMSARSETGENVVITHYYSCKEKEELINAFATVADLSASDKYDDWDISIDIIGKIDTAPTDFDENGNIHEEPEPEWTDFIFNVKFITNKYRHLFVNFKEEFPKTPFRTYL